MFESSPLQNVRLVLSRTMYAGNLGSVARLVSNFEISDFVLAAPEAQINSPEALLYAREKSYLHLQNARITNNLSEALMGCQIVIGLSRRDDGACAKSTISVSKISELLKKNKVAIVFGREDSGLCDKELNLCHFVCGLEASPSNPSLNLSHAVAVVLAQLYDRAVESEFIGDQNVAPWQEFDNLMRQWSHSMVEAELTQNGNPERMLQIMRQVFNRALLTQQEIQVFHGYISALRKAMGAIKTRQKTKS